MRYALNGVWHLSGADRLHPEKRVDLEAQVPGNVELDLFRNGIKPDPYFGSNEFLYHKYETWDWTFTRQIEIPRFDPEKEDVFLVFEGL
ncbi:MAG: glycoside hydrolase family 2 protein, partial [Clostridia bacterium]|nr:glycoside hydrolase family 2 protein [Clostridia bacterium]